MADKVTFSGLTLMADGEGNFSFQPGVFVRRGRDFVSLARGESMLMRELATRGCVHTVELRFKAMDAVTVRMRLANVFNAGVGTLTVRGFGDFYNCALIDVPALGGTSSTAKIDGSGRAMGFSVTLAFQQVAI